MNPIINCTTGTKIDIPFDAWALAKNSGSELAELHLQPKEIIPSHGNPVDVIFYVLKGSGTLRMEEKTLELKASDSIAVPKNIDREWINSGKEILKILVVKSMKA